MMQKLLLIRIALALSMGASPSAAQPVADSTRHKDRDIQPDCVRPFWLPLALPDSTGMMPFVDITGRCIPMGHVDYQKEFACGTLAPDKILIGDQTIQTGQTESGLIRKLGSDYTVLEPATWRSKLEDANYVGELMAAYAITMHFYILADLQRDGADGWFKVLEWSSPEWGLIRAYLRAERETGPYTARLLHLELNKVPREKIKRGTGERTTWVRPGPPMIIWNIDRNIIVIKQP